MISEYDKIIFNCLEEYKLYYDKFMVRIPKSSLYKAILFLNDDEINEYILFFQNIKWKTAYDEAYINILNDYKLKRRIEKIKILKYKTCSKLDM